MSLVFMALYRPKTGEENELKEILKVHIPTLREIIEIAEWKSNEAIEKAHQSENVRSVWNKISSLAELTSLSSLAEAQVPFPNFKPL